MNNDLKYRDRRIFEALNGIDEKYIAEITEKYDVFDPRAAYAPTKRAKRRMNMRILALAACIGLMVTVFCYFPQIMQTLGVPDPWGLWSQTESTDTTETPETFPPSPESEETTSLAEETTDTAPPEETTVEETTAEEVTTSPETDEETTPPEPPKEENRAFTSYDAAISILRDISSYVNSTSFNPNDISALTSKYPVETGTEKTWVYDLIDAAHLLNYNRDKAYGYSLGDTNSDGTKELIYLLDDYTVLAVFSESNGQPVLLESFWNRYTGGIDEQGRILTFGSNGFDDGNNSVYEISDKCDRLDLVAEIGRNGTSDDLKQLYYKLVNGEKVSISEDEYFRLEGTSPFMRESDIKTENNKGIKFISFEEGSTPEPDGTSTLNGGTFTVGSDITDLGADDFAGVNVNDISELIIGANVKKIDLAYLNTFENLKKMTIDAKNEYYATFTSYFKASVLVSKKTNELLYICSDELWVDLGNDKTITDLLDSGEDVKIYVGGGVLNTNFLRDDDTFYTYTYWELKSIEYDRKTKTPKNELSLGGNSGVKAFRINEGFVVSYDDYGWTYTVAFAYGKIIEYKPLVKGNVRYEVDNSGDGYQFYPGENGELLYTRTSHNMVSMQTDDWFKGFLKSPETLWKAEGSVDLSNGSFRFTRTHEYTIDDYFMSRGTTLEEWFEKMKNSTEREYFPYDTLNDLIEANGGQAFERVPYLDLGVDEVKFYDFLWMDAPLLKDMDLQYAEPDMDGDGTKELIIYGQQLIAVLKIKDGKLICSESYGFRQLLELKTDATFDWTHMYGDVLCRGTARLNFNGTKWDYVELTRVELSANDEHTYYINGARVSEDEYEKFTAGEKPRVEFKPIKELTSAEIIWKIENIMWGG